MEHLFINENQHQEMGGCIPGCWGHCDNGCLGNCEGTCVSTSGR